YTTNLVPRSVYTSGKSSSAAALTTAVAKEPETGEICIEIQSFQCVLNLAVVIKGAKLCYLF
ncbi:hypothetical protein MKW98_000046, partial [Papaver atlanticum]